MRKLRVLVLALLTCVCLAGDAKAKVNGIVSGAEIDKAVMIKPNIEYSSSSAGHKYSSGWYKIIATETGVYRLWSSNTISDYDSDECSQIWIYDSAKNTIAKENYKDGEHVVEIAFEKGNLYYVWFTSYSSWVTEGTYAGPYKCTYKFYICTPTNHFSSEGEGQYHTIVEPGCESTGVKTLNCSKCNAELARETIPAEGHKQGEWIRKRPTSCYSTGLMEANCKICGKIVDTMVLDYLEHTPDIYVDMVDPTCTMPGKRTIFCGVCGQECGQEAIAPTGHVPSTDWILFKEAECLEAGKEIIACELCNAVLKTKEIAAKGHIAGQWLDTKPATCTADGKRTQYCASCNATLATEVVKAHGHSPMDWQETEHASCLQSGLREKKCSTCGLTLESEQINALGHVYSPWEIVSEATSDQVGEKRRHCINCGDTQYIEIPETIESAIE